MRDPAASDAARQATLSSQVFAQISDPHMSSLAEVTWGKIANKRLLGYLSWRRKRKQEHQRDVLDALHRDLTESRAGHLLVTGDLTHLGLPDEFRQARQWLETLGPAEQISVVPGNHDCYTREPFAATYQQWLPYLASDQAEAITSTDACFPSLRCRGNIAFIGISTAVPTPPLFASGRVGQAQLAKLATLLAATRAKKLFRVVYLHHPPIPGSEPWRKRLVDGDQLLELLAREGAELVLHGHSHVFVERQLTSPHGIIPVVGLPSASARGDHGEPAGYNLYQVSASGDSWMLEIESRQFDRGSGKFKTVERHQLGRGPINH